MTCIAPGQYNAILPKGLSHSYMLVFEGASRTNDVWVPGEDDNRIDGWLEKCGRAKNNFM